MILANIIHYFRVPDSVMEVEDKWAVLRCFIVLAGVVAIIVALAWPAKAAEIIPHPRGCPRIAFCGCGAAVEVFGAPVRALWLARAWFKFPKTQPAPGMVAVRRGHVFVLKRHVTGKIWIVRDHNSGGHKSREHQRSLAGYVVVNPYQHMAGL